MAKDKKPKRIKTACVMTKKGRVDRREALKVVVNPGYTAVIQPNSELRAPLLWDLANSSIPEDSWPTGKEHTALCGGSGPCGMYGSVCTQKTMLIADMHTMQLVNTIKWCLRQANKRLTGSLFGIVNKSKVEVLSTVPQWRSLLLEAKKRDLRMIQGDWQGEYAEWFTAALSATVMRKLEE